MINIQPIEKRRSFDDGSILEVHSIFSTIQGEGPFAGRPAIFIRLAGCNLQCPSCDTEYTEGRKQLPIEDIISVIAKIDCADHTIIVITGGEPFRQNIAPLVDLLDTCGFVIQIETNGTLAPMQGFVFNPVVVCSPKAGKVHPSLQGYITAYKYVLSHDSIDPKDGLPILALNHSASPKVARPHAGFDGEIYLQPMDAQDHDTNAANIQAVVNSCLAFGYTLQLQIHKLIGVA